MLDRLGLPGDAKRYGAAAAVCVLALIWALDHHPNGAWKELALVTLVAAPLVLALIATMFGIDWSYERRQRQRPPADCAAGGEDKGDTSS